MLSKEFVDSLSGVVFPRKLWLLATNNEVQCIQWAKNGTTIEIDSVLLCEECFHPHIFNVKSNQHVLRQLSYYKFEKLDHKKKIWEFKHPQFMAGREELLHLIKRTPQRVPKKFVKDVERRCSSRIRSMSSKKKPVTYTSDTDEEMDIGNEDVDTKSSAKKIKLEVVENIENRYNFDYNYNCSHGVPIEFIAPSNSFSFSKSAVSEAYEGNTSGCPEKKVCPPVKRKRGRPRKSIVEPVKSVVKKQSLNKSKGSGASAASHAMQYFKQAGEIPKQETFVGYNNSYWTHENRGFSDITPMEECHSSNNIDNMPSEKISETIPEEMVSNFKEKSGENGLCSTNGSRYCDMDVDSRPIQVAPYWFISKEETWQSNLPYTSGEEIPLVLNVYEGGEVYYPIKHEDFFIENESGKNWRTDTKKENVVTNQNTNEEMNSSSENDNCLFIAEDISTFEDANSVSTRYPSFNYKSPINSYVLDNSNRDMQQYQNQTGALNASFYKKNIILSENSEIPKRGFYKIQDHDYNKPINGENDCFPLSQYNHSNWTQDNNVLQPALVSSNPTVNPSSLLVETNENLKTSDQKLTHLDDNCSGTKIDENQKSSQSKMILSVSSDCQQLVHSTDNGHYDCSSQNSKTYTLQEIIGASDFAQSKYQRLDSTEIHSDDSNYVKQDFETQKFTQNKSKLVNSNSNVNEMQSTLSDILELKKVEQNHLKASSESYPSDNKSELATSNSNVNERQSTSSNVLELKKVEQNSVKASSESYPSDNKSELANSNSNVDERQCTSSSMLELKKEVTNYLLAFFESFPSHNKSELDNSYSYVNEMQSTLSGILEPKKIDQNSLIASSESFSSPNKYELANLNSNVNKMQSTLSDIVEPKKVEQNSVIAPSESYSPFVNSSVETTESSYEVGQQNSKNSSSESSPDYSSQMSEVKLESTGKNSNTPPLKCVSTNFDPSDKPERDEVTQPNQNCNSLLESSNSFAEISGHTFDKMELPSQNGAVSSSAECDAQSFIERIKVENFGPLDDQIDRLIDDIRTGDNYDDDDICFLGQTSKKPELRDLFPTINIPVSNADDTHSNGVEIIEDHKVLKITPLNFFANEVKPMTLYDFLNEQLKNGKLYSWKVQESDIIIRDCTVDFSNWISLKSGGKYSIRY